MLTIGIESLKTRRLYKYYIFSIKMVACSGLLLVPLVLNKNFLKVLPDNLENFGNILYLELILTFLNVFFLTNAYTGIVLKESILRLFYRTYYLYKGFWAVIWGFLYLTGSIFITIFQITFIVISI